MHPCFWPGRAAAYVIVGQNTKRPSPTSSMRRAFIHVKPLTVVGLEWGCSLAVESAHSAFFMSLLLASVQAHCHHTMFTMRVNYSERPQVHYTARLGYLKSIILIGFQCLREGQCITQRWMFFCLKFLLNQLLPGYIHAARFICMWHSRNTSVCNSGDEKGLA
jgi:hypothetical protein